MNEIDSDDVLSLEWKNGIKKPLYYFPQIGRNIHMIEPCRINQILMEQIIHIIELIAKKGKSFLYFCVCYKLIQFILGNSVISRLFF